MTQINSYLTFNGNCREAMTFYKMYFTLYAYKRFPNNYGFRYGK
jgi:uncharacterized glyoxalase superfamily protein PhnB